MSETPVERSAGDEELAQMLAEADALAKTEDWEAAIAAYRKLLSFDRFYQGAEAKLQWALRMRETEGLYKKGQVALAAGNYAEARQLLNKARLLFASQYKDVDRLLVETWYGEGKLALDQGRLDEALPALRKARELSKSHYKDTDALIVQAETALQKNKWAARPAAQRGKGCFLFGLLPPALLLLVFVLLACSGAATPANAPSGGSTGLLDRLGQLTPGSGAPSGGGPSGSAGLTTQPGALRPGEPPTLSPGMSLPTIDPSLLPVGGLGTPVPNAPAGANGAPLGPILTLIPTLRAGGNLQSSGSTAGPTGAAARIPPAQRNNMYKSAPAMQIDAAKTYVATIKTSKGDIKLELYPQDAPQTVNNFVFLARDGFYDNLTFHRVEPGFVIQGGDPLGTGTGGPGYDIPPEIKRSHPKGAVAMARRGGPPETTPSSGSQFYITLAATPHLDGGYTSFGQVTEGMDVIEKIRRGDTIQSITIEEK